MGIVPNYNRKCARCRAPIHWGLVFCDECDKFLDRQDRLEGRCEAPSDCKRPDCGCEK